MQIPIVKGCVDVHLFLKDEFITTRPSRPKNLQPENKKSLMRLTLWLITYSSGETTFVPEWCGFVFNFSLRIARVDEDLEFS